MRRIYESSALHRDDEEPLVPNNGDSGSPQAFRSLNAGALSRRIVPLRVCHWAISVDVSTAHSEYPVGQHVPFTVTMKNALPIPITIPLRSRIYWLWTVDGFPEASHVKTHDTTEDAGAFKFDRGERKQFTKYWNGKFQVDDAEWEDADPGEYAIGAELNVSNPGEKGLADETTVQLVAE